MANFLLEQVPLFKNLTPQEIKTVKQFLVDKEYDQGTRIFKKGTIRDRLIIITDGSVALEETIDGEEIIALFKQNDCLSELSIIDQGTHDYDLVVASSKLSTLELSAYNWHTVAKKNPQLAVKIYKNIARTLKDRLNHSNNKLVTLFATGKIIGLHDSLQQIVDSILVIIDKIIPYQKALFVTFSYATRKIHIHKSIGFDKIKANTYFDVDTDPLFSKMLDNPKTVILNKNDWPEEYKKLPYKSDGLIVTPFKIQKTITGFIVLANKENRRDFSTNNKILLEAIASQLAPGIQHVMIEELVQAEKEIKQVYIDPFAKY